VTGFVPGAILRLVEPVDDLEDGYWMFVGEKKAMMMLSKAGEDEVGVIVGSGGEIREVHVDFASSFTDTGINAGLA
jgi:hypothetical protein